MELWKAIIGFILLLIPVQRNIITGKFSKSVPLDLIYRHKTAIPLGAITNNTLNFGRIYVINLPSRPDRRKDMENIAKATGISLDIIDASKFNTPEDIVNATLPYHSPDTSYSKLACYNSHARVWKKVLEQDEETALVLEDDVDWDVNLKRILLEMEEPLAALDSHLGGNKKRKKNWDILRLGTCLDPPYIVANETSRNYIWYEDSHIAELEWTSYNHRETLEKYQVPMVKYPNRKVTRYRVIQKSNYPVCMHAYAITKAGASRLIELTAEGLIDGANDLTIARHTEKERIQSFTVIPPVFSQWKTEGWEGNSDNGHGGGVGRISSDSMREPISFAWDIRRSIRNYENISNSQ